MKRVRRLEFGSGAVAMRYAPRRSPLASQNPGRSLLIRPLTAQDGVLVRKFLYQALHIPAGQPPFPAEIVDQPELRRYSDGWGRPGDSGVVAQLGGLAVGVAWLRLWTPDEPGYGYVDAATPELSIAVLPDYRGRGIGRQLLDRLLDQAQGRWPAVSLSVDRDNPAGRLYARLGFAVVAESGASQIMVKSLRRQTFQGR
ncbi:MAG: GNAT family N-acetyltransferase [Anaerolineales bacterium]|nr:GNAT family N-acetyltransferase [Anaerolineales bacterium]